MHQNFNFKLKIKIDFFIKMNNNNKICLVSIVMDYLERILSDSEGIKALLVDEETLGSILIHN